MRAPSVLLFLAASCALEPPPVDDVLHAGGAPPRPPTLATLADGEGLQAQLDASAQGAVTAAEAAPADADRALAAAHALFLAADLRLQRASLEIARKAQTLAAVLAADDEVGDPARTEILGLCSAGLAHAEKAAKAPPYTAGARLHVAMHLSLVAWANGPTRALMAGYGSRLARECDAAVALDPLFDSAGPLRLLGRFRSKAPWPVGDRARAKQALTRAVETAPIAINLLFLGDALAAGGELDAARQAWLRASTAPGDDSTAASLPWHRELSRLRLTRSEK